MKFEVIPNQQTPKVPEISDVDAFLKENQDVLNAFIDYARTKYNAVGLACNQVSCNDERLMLRAFAKRVSSNSNECKLIVNPVITEYVGIKELKTEGCLTWERKVVVAERNRGVRVSYYDNLGEQHTGFYHGFEAQVWQHEINHLNGVEETITTDWMYVNSIKDIEVGRNELCPCGSEKKYKNCCLNLK